MPNTTIADTDRMLRPTLATLCLAACASYPPAQPFAIFTGPPLGLANDDGVVIAGLITDSRTDEPIAGALVFVHCNCLPDFLELTSDDDGIYRAIGLPSGEYTVQVLAREANVNKSFFMPPQAKLRADYSLDPDLRHFCGWETFPRGFGGGQPWVLMGNLDLPLQPPR